MTNADSAPLTPPTLVLDTNVVLDWLLFDDPGVRALGAALTAGTLQWVATAPMLAELADVLQRPFALGRAARPEDVLRRAGQACRVVEPPPPVPPAPRCRDGDDQKFIDLALALPARWLVTRDKALLDLRRPAGARGVTVLPPARWMPDGGEQLS
jgi:predicted nucleic acid-binding protein